MCNSAACSRKKLTYDFQFFMHLITINKRNMEHRRGRNVVTNVRFHKIFLELFQLAHLAVKENYESHQTLCKREPRAPGCPFLIV
jgi:hypothetical protein